MLIICTFMYSEQEYVYIDRFYRSLQEKNQYMGYIFMYSYMCVLMPVFWTFRHFDPALVCIGHFGS